LKTVIDEMEHFFRDKIIPQTKKCKILEQKINKKSFASSFPNEQKVWIEAIF